MVLGTWSTIGSERVIILLCERISCEGWFRVGHVRRLGAKDARDTSRTRSQPRQPTDQTLRGRSLYRNPVVSTMKSTRYGSMVRSHRIR